MLRGSAGFIASRLEELSAGARTSAKTSRVVRVGVNAAAALTSTATRRERRVKAIITSDYGKERGVWSTAWRARTKTLECPSQRQGHRERAANLPVPLYIAYQGMNLTARSKIALEMRTAIWWREIRPTRTLILSQCSGQGRRCRTSNANATRTTGGMALHGGSYHSCTQITRARGMCNEVADADTHRHVPQNRSHALRIDSTESEEREIQVQRSSNLHHLSRSISI